MASWISGDVRANGIRMHYTRTGGAKPPLVLAHGFSDDGLCWTPVAEALQADYDVIMVDARCHGQSEAPDAPFGLPDQVEDLAGAITALGLEKPFILGHSMGAMNALALAGMYPEMPRAVLLEDPGARWMTDANPPARGDEWWQRTRQRLAELKSKTRERLIAEQRAASPSWSEAELGPWAESKLRLNPNVCNRRMEADLDWPALCRRITCPVLLITGDPEKGAMVRPDQAEALRALVPQLRVAHVPGAGHSIRREGFSRYMDAVRTFLAEVTATEEISRQVARLKSKGFPVIDFHTHLKGGLTLEEALAHTRATGVEHGIAVNGGVGFPITDDAGIEAFRQEMAGRAPYIGLQAEGREWPTLFSREAIAKFDYVFTDAMTIVDHRGRRARLWIPEEVHIPDKQAFMERLVATIEGILDHEPVDIYANPTYLPAVIAAEYDDLWTPERQQRVVDAAARNGVAIEINARLRLPHADLIRRAKAAGIRFTFGTNNVDRELGHLEYALQVVRECGLSREDMWMPKPDGRKPCQVRK